VPIGPRRLLRGVAVDLEHVRDIRGALGGTVNDVLLAGACAGLRELLLSRGEELPYRGLRAMVPMNVRREGEQLGNRVSSLFVELPVGDPDPMSRYTQIREGTAAIKASSQPLGADTLLALSELAPPVLHSTLARNLFGKRLFNLTITNVPGPQGQMTVFGSPLESVWPLVPIASDHAVGLAIVSYAGRLMYGICADRDAMPDVDVLASGIAAGLASLQRLVAGHPAPPV
jgi:WS/DGAT/MGAT family acyltransferase